MKFERTNRFKADWRRLTEDERALFREAVVRFHTAAEEQARHPGQPWPTSLRVKAVQGAPGVWEMTWSFAGPDGRATFEWVAIAGAAAIRGRRIGGHGVFRLP